MALFGTRFKSSPEISEIRIAAGPAEEAGIDGGCMSGAGATGASGQAYLMVTDMAGYLSPDRMPVSRRQIGSGRSVPVFTEARQSARIGR
jgi:hypothetical protein